MSKKLERELLYTPSKPLSVSDELAIHHGRLDAIDEEIDSSNNSIVDLTTQLNNEAINRANADSNLQRQINEIEGVGLEDLEAINTKVDSNTANITTLQTDLSKETTDRLNKDSELESNIALARTEINSIEAGEVDFPKLSLNGSEITVWPSGGTGGASDTGTLPLSTPALESISATATNQLESNKEFVAGINEKLIRDITVSTAATTRTVSNGTYTVYERWVEQGGDYGLFMGIDDGTTSSLIYGIDVDNQNFYVYKDIEVFGAVNSFKELDTKVETLISTPSASTSADVAEDYTGKETEGINPWKTSIDANTAALSSKVEQTDLDAVIASGTALLATKADQTALDAKIQVGDGSETGILYLVG